MDLDKNHSDVDNMSEVGMRKLGSSANEYDTCTTATISSPEPEEYTYEGAIQNYKSRIIPRTQSTDLINNKVNGLKDAIKEKSPDSYTNGNLRRTSLGNKIENKLSSFEQRRSSSVELNNVDTNKKVLPKVDVLKRRELFEKESSPESNGLSKKLNGDLSNSKSIKDRLSHLEKLTEHPDTVKSTSVLPTEVSSLKQRLSSLEKHVAVTDRIFTKLSNGDLSNVPSVRDRLSSLKSHNSQDKLTVNNVMSSGKTQTIKERLSNLDSATNKSVIRSPEREITIKLKQNNGYDDMEFREDSSYESHQNSSERNSSPESGLYDSKRFHRSLDSLDTDDNLPAGKFERIQSSEDLCGEAGTGGETDREDSGIHTGDVSCAVSHADETGEDHLSLTLLGTSTISQDTVVNVDGILSEYEQPDTEECSYKDFCPVLSHSSVTEDDPPTVEEATDVFFDREEEDTVKSLEPDTSVSLQENSVGSESDMVFEGKMLIHVNFKEICSKLGNSLNNLDSTCNNTNQVSDGGRVMPCDMPMVMVSEMSTNKSSLSSKTCLQSKPEPPPKPKLSAGSLQLKCNTPTELSPVSDKFVQSPPVLESSGRWTILQINNRSSPCPSQPITPILDMPEIIPANLPKEEDYEYNCLEEKFVFKVCNNFFTEHSHGKSQSLSSDVQANLETN